MKLSERFVQLLFILFFSGMFLVGSYMMITRPAQKWKKPPEKGTSVSEQQPAPPASSTAEPSPPVSAPPAPPERPALPGIGEATDSTASAHRVMAYTAQERYPVGTQEVALLIANRADGELQYAQWFNLYRMTDGKLEPLALRADAQAPLEQVSASHLLAAGEMVTITIPLDIFDPPLSSGTYRAEQLARFVDAKGQTLAYTEICAEFILEG